MGRHLLVVLEGEAHAARAEGDAEHDEGLRGGSAERAERPEARAEVRGRGPSGRRCGRAELLDAPPREPRPALRFRAVVESLAAAAVVREAVRGLGAGGVVRGVIRLRLQSQASEEKKNV